VSSTTAKHSASRSDALDRPPGPVLVLADTNAMFWPFTHGIRFASELSRLFPGGTRLLVPSSASAELGRLEGRGVAGAKLARSLAETLPTLPVPGRGDDGILAAAVEHNAVVATADRELTERLRAAGRSVLVPRDRARLELLGPRRRRAVRATVKTRAPLGRRSSAGT
jgi:rRNA-processing protein FCF1